MTTLTEVFESIADDSKVCDLTTGKVNVYLDALYREYDIMCEEAELKVMKESGTTDDLAYLCEEATDGVIKKTIDGIKKIFETVIKFIKDLGKKIADFVTGKTTKDAVDKMEEAIKDNPELGKTKIEIPNFEADDKWYQKIISKFRTTLAKIKGGNMSKSIVDDADEAKAEIEKRRKKGAFAAGVVTVTVAAAILLLKKMNKKDNAVDFGPKGPLVDIDVISDDCVKLCDTVKGTKSIEQTHALKQLSTNMTYAYKARSTARADAIRALYTSIGDGIRGQKMLTQKDVVYGVDNEALKREREREKLYSPEARARVQKNMEKFNIPKKDTFKKESVIDDSYLDSILGSYNEKEDVDSLFDSIVESVNSDDSFSIMDSIDEIF